ncbi:hypothetical protein [Glaciibacter psychrotolerans]|uniref:Uncharacterized protein n=1 Tax=Glaciibacter psychrotolerans TaxID=670054 RepID=A0A7Z0EBE8_9MICO|nr:hypothetical protein [Leifsonia psychrotolerans]NYJ18510.1 hypothetical protein [Leifsonia psychrotolerans]
MFDDHANAPASRWISVVFLRGEEANEMLDLISDSGPASAIEHLQQWDFGDETTDAALTNGYVYDRIPAAITDRTVEVGGSPYALTYSSSFGYVSLLRRYSPSDDTAFASEVGTQAIHPARARHADTGTWAAARNRSTPSAGHMVSL